MADRDGRTLYQLLARAIETERRAQERYLCAALLADCGGRLLETFSRFAEDSARREAELRLRLSELMRAGALDGTPG